ncbi:hypothetical protein AB833_01700 [Chromatiales bacterium (ex Bugula neritina AB1)]|nr:hypothetical protein AB833_01700 [Chromatiales bacterium (ex Bugula neritina AB1)]
MQYNKWKLITFDLDGTLIRGMSTAEHLAGKMGGLEKAREYEELYTQGKITGRQFAEFDCSRYKGHSRKNVAQHLEDIPAINHIEATLDILSRNSIHSAICTLAWTFLAETVALRYGFSDYSGASLELDENYCFTGGVNRFFHAEDKVSYVEKLCVKHAIEMSQVVHIGDSTSDLYLFDAVGYSIALNGSAQAIERADTSVNSESLLDTLAVIPDLLPVQQP